MTVGWSHYQEKPAEIFVPRNKWTTVTGLVVVEGFGPTYFDPQVYGRLPVKPTTETIIGRLGRMGQPDGDRRWTQRAIYEVGDRTAWSGVGRGGVEWVGEGDGPFAYQLFHTFASPIVLTTVILKAINWTAFGADRALVDG